MERDAVKQKKKFRPARVRGAFGGPAKRAARLNFIGDSQRQANRIANERAVKKAYREFYATPEGKKFDPGQKICEVRIKRIDAPGWVRLSAGKRAQIHVSTCER
jgi:hypothetical protein